MANGTPGPPLPGWLGQVVQVTTQVGVPTVFAAVLLWFVLTRVDTSLKTINENEEARTRMLAAMQDTLVATLDRQTRSFEAALQANSAANRQILLELRRDAH